MKAAEGRPRALERDQKRLVDLKDYETVWKQLEGAQGAPKEIKSTRRKLDLLRLFGRP